MSDKYAVLKTLVNELRKTYVVLDGSNRITFAYEAKTDAKHGDPCMVTEYRYSGLTSFVIGVKETQGTWDSSFDSTAGFTT